MSQDMINNRFLEESGKQQFSKCTEKEWGEWGQLPIWGCWGKRKAMVRAMTLQKNI